MEPCPSPTSTSPAQLHQWIQIHGEAATAKAREMVERMRKKGDKDGADVWLRIIVALGTSGDPPSAARH